MRNFSAAEKTAKKTAEPRPRTAKPTLRRVRKMPRPLTRPPLSRAAADAAARWIIARCARAARAAFLSRPAQHLLVRRKTLSS